MKLFVFEPSTYWTYCGGVLMTTANSYEEACKRLQVKEPDAKFRTTDFIEKPSTIEYVDAWVLLHELELAPGQSDVCLIEYQYA